MKEKAENKRWWCFLVVLSLLGLAVVAQSQQSFGAERTVAQPPSSGIRRAQTVEEVGRGAPPMDVVKPGGQGVIKSAVPQLALVAVGINNAAPRVGERIIASATLKNLGSTTIPGVKVQFFLREGQIGEQVVTVPGWGSAIASVNFSASQAGSQTLRVQAVLGLGIAPLTQTRVFKVSEAESKQAFLTPQQIPYEKPLQAKKGSEFNHQPGGTAVDSGSPGSPPGSGGPSGPHDPTKDLGDKNKPKGLPTTTPWGSSRMGKADLGDGIMGKDDQGDMPKTNLGEGIPQKPINPTTVGPHKGGPDAGYYGGVSPKYNPGGAAKGKEGKGKDLTYREKNKDGSTTSWYSIGFKQFEDKYTVKGIIIGTDKKGNITSILHDYGDGYWRKWEAGTGKTSDSDSGPVARDIKVDPRQDPQLIVKLTKLADKQKKGDSFRPDEGVSDPVQIKGSKATSGSPEVNLSQVGELAAAGAAKAEAKWRFAGKKPGSGVTDPAEWQDSKIRDFSMARIKHFEVIDPVEAPGLQSAQAKGEASAKGATQSVTISSVTGNVQKLTTQGGKQGWAPLKAGDKLVPGSILRVDRTADSEVGLGKLDQALKLNWRQVQQTSGHTIYQLKLNE